ncbi:MAG: hypothetical protein ACXWCM_04650 [Acidimicrobiales bacterium]
MSDFSQGEGWWQASDGKWYPPEQAPGYQPSGYQAAAGPGGGGTGVGDALSYAWTKFTQNIGEWIVLWLIYLAVAVILVVVAITLAVGGAATNVGFRFNFLGIGIGLVAGVIQGVLLVVVAKGAVMAVNGQKVDIGAAFKLTGNNIAAGALFGLIYGGLNSFCFLFGIGAWMLLGFVPVISALDDKGADALGEATSVSTSHFGEAGVFMLVGWLITGCTCGIGGPIAMLGGTYLVKRYRNEPVAP